MRAPRLWPLLGVAVLALSATSCGGTTTPTSPVDGPVAGQIAFSWWGGSGRNKKTNAVADLFEQQHPGVRISRQPGDFSSYWSKLNVQAAGENLPCVTQTQARQLNEYTANAIFRPLDDLVASGAIDVSQIPPKILDSGRGTDGRLYAIPYGAAYDSIMYNATAAQRAGVGDLPPDVSWPQFADWLRHAQPGLPSGMAAADLRGELPSYFLSWITGHGYSLFRDGEVGFPPQVVADYWRWWEDLRATGATTSPAMVVEEPSQPEQGYLAQGRVLSDTRPGNAVTPVQESLDAIGGGEVKVAPHPTGPAGLGNVIITTGLSIPASCPNASTAAAFIDFFVNDPQAAAIYSSDNGAVTNTALLQQQLRDPELAPSKRAELSLYQEILRRDPQIVLFPAGYEVAIDDNLKRSYERVAFGLTTVDQAAQEFVVEANRVLRQSAGQ
ncbi:extracellular solute-binding protein [Saccharopolyspora sp. K220]|uniref:ABC transporter substrate-binding protein n=1 Tax=Saccharopolyspora soli TaxID=2926618 RepID=UPI001F58CAC8|nr:extracellular solute-binding protein [Saccharopolyspora soli]MCI2417868.1 extracellular solute-binding protein [Saccharopolyspora soli]